MMLAQPPLAELLKQTVRPFTVARHVSDDVTGVQVAQQPGEFRIHQRRLDRSIKANPRSLLAASANR